MTDTQLIQTIQAILPETKVTRWRKATRVHLPRKLGKIIIHEGGAVVCTGKIPPMIGEILVDHML